MSSPVLQLKDGFASESPELQDDVRKLQTALLKAGYDLDADGLFGKETEDAVKDIQRKNGLLADGIIGAMQQDHKLEGIRKRRRMEADLIRKELSSRRLSGAQAVGRPQPASVAGIL